MQAYQQKSSTVEAVRLQGAGTLKWRSGDWLLLGADRVPSVMKDQAFCAQFEQQGDREPAPKKARRSGKRPGKKPGRKASAKATPPVRRVGATKAPAPGKRSRYPAEQVSEARRLIEGGTSIKDTAEQLGLKYNTVYVWAKANGWDSK